MAAISVVIPTYNRAELIGATLRSVATQSLPPSEIIIVDDGSTDDTYARCEALGLHTHYIRQDNRGLSAARNVGIRAASGDWVALCDSDDLWRPTKLELQYAATKAVGADWSATGFGVVDPNGTCIPVDALGFEETFPVFHELKTKVAAHFSRWLELESVTCAEGAIPVFSGDAFPMLFAGNVVLPSTALISRRVFARVGMFDEAFRGAEETEFFHRAAAQTRAAFVMAALADYRVGHASLIKNDPSRHIRFAIESIDRASRLRPLTEVEQNMYRSGRKRLQARLAYALLSALDRGGARSVLLEGWRKGGLSTRNIAIFFASLLPCSTLQRLHTTKQRLTGRHKTRQMPQASDKE